MRGPPDPDMRKAALADGPVSHSPTVRTEQNATSPLDLQARSLRRRFALAHYLAVTVAQLAWGELPR
jgi:hypothetical protein